MVPSSGASACSTTRSSHALWQMYSLVPSRSRYTVLRSTTLAPCEFSNPDRRYIVATTIPFVSQGLDALWLLEVAIARSVWLDVVLLASVNNAVSSLNIVGPRSCNDSTKSRVCKFVARCTWAFCTYVKGCIYMSQFLWCSATSSRGMAKIVLLNRSARPFVCGWYDVVVRFLAPRKAKCDLNNLLTICVPVSANTCVVMYHTAYSSYLWKRCNVQHSHFFMCVRLSLT